MKRLVWLFILLLVVGLFLTACHEEKGPGPSTSQPTVTSQPEKTQPEEATPPSSEGQGGMSESTETTVGPGEGGSEEGGYTIEQEQGKGTPTLSTDNDLVQYVWKQFMQQQGVGPEKAAPWVDQIMNRIENKKLYPKKVSQALKNFLVALVSHCSSQNDNPLCQRPWELPRYPLIVFDKDRISSAQQTQFMKNIKRIIIQNTGLSDKSEIESLGASVAALFWGEAPCVQKGLCLFEEEFPQLKNLNAQSKEGLLIAIFNYIDEMLNNQRWPQRGSAPWSNIVIIGSK